ncbi:membrane protein [Staphylococcus phage vB_SsapH-Golestan101-M]|nr:membrane protein [Staphylococcus phage vB_SsapH-Golestan101-M]
MNSVLEFVLWYIWYLIMGVIGVWIGSLIMGSDVNPFTSWIPYTLALVLTLLDFVLNKE